MGPLPLLLLSIVLAAVPAAAEKRDVTFLYGPEQGQTHPNPSQLQNRHLSLLEWALLDTVFKYASDAQSARGVAAMLLQRLERGNADSERQTLMALMMSFNPPQSERAAWETKLRAAMSQFRSEGDLSKDEQQVARLLGEDAIKHKSGYGFDRKASYAAAWAGYERARDALSAEDRRLRGDRRAPYVALDPAPAAAWADGLRQGALKSMAEDYLRAPAPPPGAILSDFEADLIFAYLKWVPDVNEVIREWLRAVIPQTPEDRYLHALRIQNCRAVLRGRLSAWLASPPSGAQDPAPQYAEVETLSQAVINNNRSVLEPLYAASGLAIVSPPRPEPTPSNPAAVPFVKRFTDQEHAILSAVTLGGHADFDQDRAEADADGAKSDTLLAKWRARAREAATAYLAERPAARSPERALDSLSLFESLYLEWRLDRLSAPMRDALHRLAREAEQSKVTGDVTAFDRLAAPIRAAIRTDIASYVADPIKPDAAVKAWADRALAAEQSFLSLYPAPRSAPSEGEPRAGIAPRDAAIDALFSDPVERAAARIVFEKGGESLSHELARLVAAASLPEGDPARASIVADWRSHAAAVVKTQLETPDAGVAASFAAGGVSRAALESWYCERRARPAASATTPSARDQLRQASRESDAHARSDESAAASSGFESSPAIDALCRGRAAESASRQPASAPAVVNPDSLTVPEPGRDGESARLRDGGPTSRVHEPKPAAAGGAKPPSGLGGVLKSAAIGAGILGLIGLAIAAVIGLGPIGLAAVALTYAAVGAAGGAAWGARGIRRG